MCWHTRQESNAVKKVVTGTPLKVYKIGYSCCYRCFEQPETEIFRSYYKAFKYRVGEVYSLDTDLDTELKIGKTRFLLPEKVWDVEEGYHAYSFSTELEIVIKDLTVVLKVLSSKKSVDTYSGWLDYKNLVVATCTLPVGTEYYQNEFGEIVANKIRIDKLQSVEELNQERENLE